MDENNFEIDGVKYKAVHNKGFSDDCSKCCFFGKIILCFVSRPPCLSELRTDKRAVIFVEDKC